MRYAVGNRGGNRRAILWETTMPGTSVASTVIDVHQDGQLSAGSLVRGWFRLLVGLSLGSVTGLVGLAAAALGTHVI